MADNEEFQRRLKASMDRHRRILDRLAKERPKERYYQRLGRGQHHAGVGFPAKMWDDILETLPHYMTYSEHIRNLVQIGLDITLHREDRSS